MRKNFWLGSILALSLISGGTVYADQATQQYTIVAGDTLKIVAQKYGITLSQLIAANPQIPNYDMISIGQKVNIPIATASASPTSTSTSTSNPSSTNSTTNGTSTNSSVTSVQQYTVVAGDTLKIVAQKYGITLSQLIAANPQIPNFDMISIGLKVNIPNTTVNASTTTSSPAPAPTNTASSQSTNTSTNVSTSPASGGTSSIIGSTTNVQQYTVVAGDMFKTIAQKFGLTTSQLIAANPQISNYEMISIGMKINIPSPNSGASSTASSSTVTTGSVGTTQNTNTTGSSATTSGTDASGPVSATPTTSTPGTTTVKPAWEQKADAVITTGMTQLGVPYVFGGAQPGVAFDCSGFTQYAFNQNGYNLPHSSAMQSDLGTFIEKNNLRKGDLIFLQGTYTTGVSHVAIYLGNNQMLQAGTLGTREVKISQLFGTSYYDEHYWGAKRIIQD